MTLDVRLKPGTNGVYHTFSRAGTTAAIRSNVGKCLERTALPISLMRQVAKVDMPEAFDELREGGETSSRRSTDGR